MYGFDRNLDDYKAILVGNKSDLAMERVGMFRSLEEVWIEGTAVSDRGLKSLHRLTNLTFISIVDCEHICHKGVAELQKAIPGVQIH